MFNTPSHHRVHHASQGSYLDRNYGGILIVWDRLFGTFAAENDAEPCRYGITRNIDTFNPLRVAVHQYAAIGRDLATAHLAGPGRLPVPAARLGTGRRAPAHSRSA